MPRHPLDSPIWSALTGPHAAFAVKTGRFLRYRPDVAMFVAAGSDEGGIADLADVLEPGDGVVVFSRTPVTAPPGLDVVESVDALQMVAETFLPGPEGPPLVPLGDADVPAMLALTHLTHPGPFLPRTIELGGYLGIRDGDSLVAMAGRRMHPPGYVEISAVCTHPDYQGRGFARALMSGVGRRIVAEGSVPFLHVRADNGNAIALYRSLGFRARPPLTITFLRKR